MNEHDLNQHLSQIVTQWTMLYRAHKGHQDEAAVARQELMLRYCGAVYRYLLRSVRDPALAEDLTQEFALRFLQGRFGQADRDQGRFRHYVKRALFHLIQDHHRGRLREPPALAIGPELDVAAPEDLAAERDFQESWRQELLSRAWAALEVVQRQTGHPYHDLLRLRVDQPDLTSTDLAAMLTERLGKPFSATGVRQLVHRARAKFAELLLDDIRQSMEQAPLDRVEEELAELDLLKYCKDAIDGLRG